jgi:hypothetical protein
VAREGGKSWWLALDAKHSLSASASMYINVEIVKGAATTKKAMARSAARRSDAATGAMNSAADRTRLGIARHVDIS